MLDDHFRAVLAGDEFLLFDGGMGTMLQAARDAVIVFYSIVRDENGMLTDADFNFVERSIFEQTYERIG